MKRRLTISILATLWVILIAGGVVAFLTTRSILLEDLDHTLLMQAVVTAKTEFPAEFPNLPVASDARVYLVEQRRTASPDRTQTPEILRAAFTDNGQLAMRTMTVRVNGPTSSKEIVASLPTTRYDAYVKTLLWSLGGFIVITGVVVAAVARAIASSALRPVVKTAETIEAIHERSLDQRITVESLPVELRPMVMRLNEMLARLDGSFAARRQFLADASHELRTPVAALVTSLEVALSRPRSSEQYHETLTQALQDARFLQQLSEGLLEAARAERDASADEALDVSATLTACCDMLEPLARQKGVAFSRSIDRRMVDSFDERRIRSIAINLASNAIEYNRPGGSVAMEASICRREEIAELRESKELAGVSHLLLIRVKDTGVGIEASHLSHIFDPFYRVDAVRTQKPGLAGENTQIDTPHMGLGLALVKRHVEAMRGEIKVSSNIGQGTAFMVMLPAIMAAQISVSRPIKQAESVHPSLITSRVVPV